MRSYHEITNKAKSNYIPNFDNYPISKKRQVLKEIFDLRNELMSKSDIEIEYEFNKKIYRTIKDIERDLARPS